MSRLRSKRDQPRAVPVSQTVVLQGFNQEDLEGDGKAKQKVQAEEESDSDEGVDRSGQE